MVHVEGKFGGILFLWDRTKLEGRVIVSSPCFCSIFFTSLATLKTFIVTNVYAPTTCVGRKVLWFFLNQMHEAFMGLSWIVFGYFNASLLPLKKQGGVEVFNEGMQNFDRFINENNLMDLDLKRIKFTWTNGSYGVVHIQKKLDRILISQDYLTRFGDASLMGYLKNKSNHNSLLLETQDQRRYFNAPFLFEIMWLTHKIMEEHIKI